MSDTEKRGSSWPWIVVPLASLALFLGLRECQHRLPPSERASAAPAVTIPTVPGQPAPATPVEPAAEPPPPPPAQ